MTHTEVDPHTAGAPRVSVCVALCNHAPFVDESIDSILAQDFQDLEIVIVDDGSTDGSLEQVQLRAAGEPRIRVFTHEGGAHRGISAACNRAIGEARGEFISFIASDDAWYPGTLETLYAELERQPELGFVYGPVELATHDGKRTGKVVGGDITRYRSQLEAIIHLNIIPTTTLLVRRECFDRVGLLNESLLYSDWEILIRVLSRYRAGFVDRPLALYRVHKTNTSTGPCVSPEKIRSDSRAALLAARECARELGDERRILAAIDKGLKLTDERVAGMYLDRYFTTLYGDAGACDVAALKLAWQMSPREVCRPRRAAAIAKSLLVGLTRRVSYAIER